MKFKLEIFLIGIFAIIVLFSTVFLKKKKAKAEAEKKKPYKWPPNVHFYKDGEVVWKVYADREAFKEILEEAKAKYSPDGYMTMMPTGRTAFISLEKKRKKHWGSNY